jgi:hypothetical protein
MNQFKISFLIISLFLLYWQAINLYKFFKLSSKPKWYSMLNVITRSIFVLVIILGLFAISTLEKSLTKVSWVELSGVILLGYSLLAWVQNNIFSHLAKRKKPEISGGGELQPSLNKALVNFFLFVIYSCVVAFSFYSTVAYSIIIFTVQACLYCIGFIFRNDIFSPSKKTSDYVL